VLTEAGTVRVDEVVPGHLALIEQWFTGRLEPAQLDAFLAALRVLRDAVRPGAVAGSGVVAGQHARHDDAVDKAAA
jgi:MarR family transcriptional regulator, 2-MHQ and catechol-resistance regulon repressor